MRQKPACLTTTNKAIKKCNLDVIWDESGRCHAEIILEMTKESQFRQFGAETPREKLQCRS
jgi:hypothetical protein